MSGETQPPGIHSSVLDLLDEFPEQERKIVRKLAREWFVTRVGYVHIGHSKYRYTLLKPTASYQEMFNLDREVIAILSNYDMFQPRTLDAISKVVGVVEKLRIEKICSVILSADPNVETKVRDLLKSDEESQVVIPISYQEYLDSADDFYLRNKFKANFYTRDLFAFQGPLRKDLYFFGRTDLIHKIVSRHNSNENSGLFGLRKSGKTSVIFGVERALNAKNALSVVIDCQDTGFNQRRWNEALWYVVYQLRKKYELQGGMPKEDEFSTRDASLAFESQMKKIRARLSGTNILLIFDEIENITPGVSAVAAWDQELDFVHFWQTLRSVYQRNEGLFSYLIVGTNPTCIERSKFHDKANPLFMSIPFEYIEPFDVDRTREMIHKLGRIMGLKFDQLVYGKLTEDYGGHPFLMRHVCSVINDKASTVRPVVVSRTQYRDARELFDGKYDKYVEMILEVLETHFRDEYEMLGFLAREEFGDFQEFAAHSPSYTMHLLGYGLIEVVDGKFDFKIDVIKKYLLRKQTRKPLVNTEEQMWAEISQRRNAIEPRLRKQVRNQLRAELGSAEARTVVLHVMGEARSRKYGALSYNELFDPSKGQIYWEDLRKLIAKNWPIFKNLFGEDAERFNQVMKAVNRARADAHSSPLTESEFSNFRVCMDELEGFLAELD